jgi:hypothetical protein
MNAYPILKFPNKAVYQYEVSGLGMKISIYIIW